MSRSARRWRSSQAATPSEPEDKPVEPETPEAEVKPEIEILPLPEKPNAAAVLAQPLEAKQQEKPREQQPKPDKPKTAPKKPQDRAAKNAQATTAPQAANLQRAVTNAAPMSGTSASVAPATWRSMIMALLHRHKRLPPGAGRGTATVAFTVDRSGNVLSARLVRSSGDAALDQEAVALARRISPVPGRRPRSAVAASCWLSPSGLGNDRRQPEHAFRYRLPVEFRRAEPCLAGGETLRVASCRKRSARRTEK